MNALILFSHGSLLCGSGEALDAHAARLRALGEWDMVEVGYLNYSVPPFAQAVAKCASAGVDTVVVQPFFLVPGYFVTTSLPKSVRAMQAEHPGISFVIADAIGYDERLADALIESASDPLGPDEWRDDLTAAARNCRVNPECPLHGSPKCPKARS
jgi:sirohydrochlorin ferrochelatase